MTSFVKTGTLKDVRKALISTTTSQYLNVVFLKLPTCGHCLAMEPIIEQLAEEFHCCQVQFYKVDVSSEPDNSLSMFATSIHQPRPNGFPTFYAFHGSKYLSTTRGSTTIDAFRAWMDKNGLDCSMCASTTK
jgi:thiol-disulfide isomerase/thioredoxin